ncbi:unnamed protein product [Acanthosepion pharaonis]|uniref:Uncharacterized protein n=1 Tax=Acanthosepion pharaonis TaxID=158019 RepID=A0A812DZB8_ACAPH|nr:unnamed protein product [Sepia pharaonis]
MLFTPHCHKLCSLLGHLPSRQNTRTEIKRRCEDVKRSLPYFFTVKIFWFNFLNFLHFCFPFIISFNFFFLSSFISFSFSCLLHFFFVSPFFLLSLPFYFILKCPFFPPYLLFILFFHVSFPSYVTPFLFPFFHLFPFNFLSLLLLYTFFFIFLSQKSFYLLNKNRLDTDGQMDKTFDFFLHIIFFLSSDFLFSMFLSPLPTFL